VLGKIHAHFTTLVYIRISISCFFHLPLTYGLFLRFGIHFCILTLKLLWNRPLVAQFLFSPTPYPRGQDPSPNATTGTPCTSHPPHPGPLISAKMSRLPLPSDPTAEGDDDEANGGDNYDKLAPPLSARSPWPYSCLRLQPSWQLLPLLSCTMVLPVILSVLRQVGDHAVIGKQ
jgi:hypothetical protein